MRTSRVMYMLHKCNRARREHVASNMLFYLIGNFALRRNLELKGPDKTGPRKAEVYWL